MVYASDFCNVLSCFHLVFAECISVAHCTFGRQLLGAMFICLCSTQSHVVQDGVEGVLCDSRSCGVFSSQLLCEPDAVCVPLYHGSARLGSTVETGLPKSSSAGEGSLLSIGVTLICSKALCRWSLFCCVFFTVLLTCRTCLSTKPLLLG